MIWPQPWAALRRRVGDDAGSAGGLALVSLVAAMVLLLVFGLIVDGGAKAEAADRANRIAMEAARAGAQSLTRAEQGVPVDQVVQQYLAAENVSGTSAVDGDRVDVTVQLSAPTRVLGLIGYSSIQVTGSGFAYAIYSPADE